MTLSKYFFLLGQAGQKQENHRTTQGMDKGSKIRMLGRRPRKNKRINKSRIRARRSGKIRKQIGFGKKAGVASNPFHVRPPAGLRTSCAPSMT